MCVNYLDDIIVSGKTNEEHLQNLQTLFCTLQQNGLKCKLNKCEFFKSEITYLGHVMNWKGITPTDTHLEAIKSLPEPKDLKQLQSFMGKINYYVKFIKNAAHISAPLNELRKKGQKFIWTDKCSEAYRKLKEQLLKKPCLAHFQPDKQLTVAADASEYGIGAVLSHKNEDGTETPIAYASKTLTKAQKVYPQVEKEALSLVYAVNKFHQYLYGRKFHLITDHKPLLAIFNPDSSIPQRTAQRLQRWALLLSNYNYAIHFRRTNLHANADALSRLPIGPDEDFDSQQEMVFQFDQVAGTAVQQFPLDAWKIAKETRRDNILRKVKEFIQVGWPTSRKSIKDKWLLPYFDKKESLSINQA